jgi:hypothetical protein
MTVKEYTEEFYRLNIRASHRESDDEKITRYMNGLRYEIHDEMSMVTIITVEYSYQICKKYGWNVLALCNLPKAESQTQRQHQNHFESWI